MTDEEPNANWPLNKKNPQTIEIIEDRLYFVIYNTKQNFKTLKQPGVIFFPSDDYLRYEPFFDDFGPLNLAQVHKFCRSMHMRLKEPDFADSQIWHVVDRDPKKRANAAFLIGSFMILYMGIDAEDVHNKLIEHCNFIMFRDASTGIARYTLSLLDSLKAVAKAKKFNFYNPQDFHLGNYEYYETVQNGDLNWIIPEKFVAFAGPMSPSCLEAKGVNRSSYHEPLHYKDYFNALNVKTVIRLNNPCYDASEFDKIGVKHYNMIFPDGGVPDYYLADTFLTVAEERPGAIAVHCKAGLGRTGTMIALYMMKWYKFTAMEAIAWLRICRPASVIGQQQKWLLSQQAAMWRQGLKCKPPLHKYGVYSLEKGTYLPRHPDYLLSGITSKVTNMDINHVDVNKNVENKVLTQGDRLRQIKNSRASTGHPLAKTGRSQSEKELTTKKAPLRKRVSAPVKDETSDIVRRRSIRLLESQTRRKSAVVR